MEPEIKHAFSHMFFLAEREEEMKKLLDFVAGLCLVFDVDWEGEYEDDAYVMEMRAAQMKPTRDVRPVAIADARPGMAG